VLEAHLESVNAAISGRIESEEQKMGGGCFDIYLDNLEIVSESVKNSFNKVQHCRTILS
jgi:hypothetical protein